MSTYFDHASISNSDIQKFLQQIGLKREMPANIQQIYDFGTEFHAGILEPHKKNDLVVTADQRKLIEDMAATFWRDKMCRDFAMAKDFQREMEVYDTLEVGGMRIAARCKFDGARPSIGMGLELKGVKVSSQKQFEDCLEALDYDRAIAHYLLTSKYPWDLVLGISKVYPDRLFKKIVKKHDEFFVGGEEKLRQALILLRDYSPSDVQLIAA